MRQLQEILILHTTQRNRLQGTQTLSLGDLEDIVVSALEDIRNFVNDLDTDRKTRDKRDLVVLKKFRMRPSRVNINNVRREGRYKDSPATSLKMVEKQRNKSIYMWDLERKCGLIHSALSIAKHKYARARHMSPDSSSDEDDSQMSARPPDPSPSPPPSPAAARSSSPARLSSPVNRSSPPPQPSRPSKNHSFGRNIVDSDDSDQGDQTSSSGANNKEADKRKAEIKRQKSNKQAQDPNRFKIPKKDKSGGNKDTMRLILEEGLKKVNTAASGATSSGFNRQGRYYDWRKEQRINEVRKKEKHIDLKKVSVLLTSFYFLLENIHSKTLEHFFLLTYVFCPC